MLESRVYSFIQRRTLYDQKTAREHVKNWGALGGIAIASGFATAAGAEAFSALASVGETSAYAINLASMAVTYGVSKATGVFDKTFGELLTLEKAQESPVAHVSANKEPHPPSQEKSVSKASDIAVKVDNPAITHLRQNVTGTGTGKANTAALQITG